MKAADLGRIAALAAGSFVVGRLAHPFGETPGFATLLWPPSGIALAAVLLWGYRVWPGVFLGTLLVNISVASAGQLDHPIAISGCMSVGSSIQAVVGAFLIRRFVGFPTALTSGREVALFLALGGPAACTIAATLGVGTLWVAGSVAASDALFDWLTWWVGDFIGVLIFTPLVLVWVAEPRELWARRRTKVALPMLVAMAVVTGFFLHVKSVERDRQLTEFSEQSRTLVHSLEERLVVYLEVVQLLVAFYDSSKDVTPEEFRRFTRDTLVRHPGTQALAWSPRVTDDMRLRFEEQARSEGLSEFQITEESHERRLTPAGARDAYAPVRYVEPLDGNRHLLGFDIASNADGLAALQRAVDGNEAAATGCIDLTHDDAAQCSFLLVMPVFELGHPPATVEARRRSLKGYVVSAFRTDEIVDDALHGFTSGPLALQILDITSGSGSEIYGGPWGTEAGAGIASATTYDVAGRRWVLRVSATEGYLSGRGSWFPWAVDAAGLAFVAVLGAFLLTITGRATELESAILQLHETAQARERFLSIASHELRTPLAPLRLHVQSIRRLLDEEGPVSGKAKARVTKAVAVADRQLERLVRLVEEMLDASRISAGRLTLEREPVDLAGLVVEIVDRHKRELDASGIRVTIEAPAPVVGAFDRSRIEQVVANLLINTIKHAPGKPVHVAVSATNGRARLIVQDHGPGIAPEEQDRIFKEFEGVASEGRNGGLGLGLFISHEIVEAHGGTLRVESRVGEGATFVVELPAGRGHVPRAPTPREPEPHAPEPHAPI